MGGIGATELILLAVIALLVVGPQRLPEIARTAGRWTRQARHAWQRLQSDLQSELDADHNRRILEAEAAGKTPADAAAGPETTDSSDDGDEQRPGN